MLRNTPYGYSAPPSFEPGDQLVPPAHGSIHPLNSLLRLVWEGECLYATRFGCRTSCTGIPMRPLTTGSANASVQPTGEICSPSMLWAHCWQALADNWVKVAPRHDQVSAVTAVAPCCCHAILGDPGKRFITASASFFDLAFLCLYKLHLFSRRHFLRVYFGA